MSILNNTFFGTLFAGAILARFGLFLYQKQKRIDIKYEDLRKMRELASLLFANIEIAYKRYEEQLNMYDNKNPELNLINKLFNSKTGDYFRVRFEEEVNEIVSKINISTDNLIAHLKIRGGYDLDIEIIAKNIPVFNFYLLSTSVLHLSNQDQIESFRKEIKKILDPTRSLLQKLIKKDYEI